MSIRIRSIGWEVVWETLKGLEILFSIMEKVYRNRKALRKVVPKLLRIGAGASICSMGGLMIFLVPFLSWVTFQGSPYTSAQVIQFSIVLAWTGFFFGIMGLGMFGGGLWTMAPNTRTGKFGLRLVVTHIFRRRAIRRTVSFPASSSFGLAFSFLAQLFHM